MLNQTITEVEEFKGISKWVADKIIANASGLNEAIAKVINAGYDVTEADQYLLAGEDNGNNNGSGSRN